MSVSDDPVPTVRTKTLNKIAWVRVISITRKSQRSALMEHNDGHQRFDRRRVVKDRRLTTVRRGWLHQDGSRQDTSAPGSTHYLSRRRRRRSTKGRSPIAVFLNASRADDQRVVTSVSIRRWSRRFKPTQYNAGRFDSVETIVTKADGSTVRRWCASNCAGSETARVITVPVPMARRMTKQCDALRRIR